jgi:hypothetical protein
MKRIACVAVAAHFVAELFVQGFVALGRIVSLHDPAVPTRLHIRKSFLPFS